jgi:hypothetical protein
MARDEAPPFARGETWYNLGSSGSIDLADPLGLGGVNLEGREYLFEVNSQDQGTGYPAGQDPSGRQIRVKVVRNRSGVNLKPGRIAHFLASSSYPYESAVDGYTFALGDRPAGIVDEFLPAGGVIPNDLFYIVLDGPTKVTQPASPTSVAIGDHLVPSTTGSSATDDLAGRFAKQDLTGSAATLGNNIQNNFGFAAAADNTGNDLVDAVVHFRTF